MIRQIKCIYVLVNAVAGDVAQELERRTSNLKALGSILWQCEGHIFCPCESILEQTCLCRTPTPPSLPSCTQMCAYVKDPIAMCCKRLGLTADGLITQKHCTH